MCHQINEDRAWNCRRCGYEFGQPIETVREMLLGQRRSTRIVLAILIAADLAIAAAFVWVQIMPEILVISGFSFVTLWAARSWIKLSVTRDSLRSLEAQAKAAELPKATVKSG